MPSTVASQPPPSEAVSPGAPVQQGVPAAEPPSIHVVEATVVLPDLSAQPLQAFKSNVFPWPAPFRDDLIAFLRTLRWPSAEAGLLNSATTSSSFSGVTWAELAVNFEVVIGKALPRTVSRQGAARPYGAPSVPLLSDQSDLFHKDDQ